MNPQTYSFSRLELYDSCPHAYKVVYLDKIPRATSEALATGRISHDLVGNYINRLLALGVPTDWAWAAAATPPEDSPDIQNIWTRFYESFVLPPLDQGYAEKKLAFNRQWEPVGWFDRNAWFRLVIDWTFRQGGLVVVQDWKTNRMVPETAEKSLQLRIYGWGAQRVLYPDAQEILLRLHFLRYGVEREVLLVPDDLATVPQEIEEKVACIESDKHFDPTPGSFCGWCGVTAHCPAMAGALVPMEIIAPVSREQAEKAAALLVAVRAMEKELTDRLKTWVQEHGPVQVGDLVYGPTQTVKYDLDTEAVVNQLLEAGINRSAVWGMLGVTKTSLERGLKKLKQKDLLADILAAAPQTKVQRIEFKKVA